MAWSPAVPCLEGHRADGFQNDCGKCFSGWQRSSERGWWTHCPRRAPASCKMCLVHLCPARGRSRLHQLAGTSVHPCCASASGGHCCHSCISFLGPRAASWARGAQSSTISVLGPRLPPEPYHRPGSLRSGFQHPGSSEREGPGVGAGPGRPPLPAHGGLCVASVARSPRGGLLCTLWSQAAKWARPVWRLQFPLCLHWVAGMRRGDAHCLSGECARGSLCCWSPLSSLRTFSPVG